VDTQNISIFWFRRDLRLTDNIALCHALKDNKNVLPLFIFDTEIIDELPVNDARVQFIYLILKEIDTELQKNGSSMLVRKGKPLEVFKDLLQSYNIKNIYFNNDYEPYALERDKKIIALAKGLGVASFTFKDSVIFEKDEILKGDGTPYTIFTPYARKWLEQYKTISFENKCNPTQFYNHFYKEEKFSFPKIEHIGFKNINITYPLKDIDPKLLMAYENNRNFPAIEGTTKIGMHLRFGTLSIRHLVEKADTYSITWLKELIWREFFMMILYKFPKVQNEAFKSKYNSIEWINDEELFLAWCQGQTGYPIVDAGMRELNTTGFMHNRVRMITASFLCKHLLINWQWGENYFAQKLLDYELASNNGNWQWAAGTGCDAAPYFRIFNPALQMAKYDKHMHYVKKWVPELLTPDYPKPQIEHEFARKRCLNTYKKAVMG